MRTLLHLFKWQIRQHRSLLLINSAVLALILIAPLVINSEALSSITLIGKILALLTFCILAGNMIHTQPYTGSESFWMTRPITRRKLLGAQCLLLLLWIAVPTLLGMLAITFHLDGEATHYLGTLLTWGIYMALLCFVFAIAITTPNPLVSLVVLFSIMLLTGFAAFSVKSVSSNRSPNPDTLVFLVPILGLLVLFGTALFIKKLTIARLLIIGLGVSVIPLQSAWRLFHLWQQESDLISNPSQIEIGPEPDPDADLSETSYFYPVQFTSNETNRITIPWHLWLKSDTGELIQKSFGRESTFIHPFFTDKMRIFFPDAEDIVSTDKMPPSLDTSGNEFKNRKGEHLDTVSFREEAKAQLGLKEYSMQHVGGFSVFETASKSESGLKVTIHDTSDQKGLTQIKYTLQANVAVDIYAKQRGSVYIALYDPKTKQLIIQLNQVDHLRNQAYSLVSAGTDSTLSIPSSLITPDTKLHFFLVDELSDYYIVTTAQPGTYLSR